MDTMKICELVALCKERGLRGYSGKKKAELVQMLGGAAAAAPAPDTSTSIVKPVLKWVGGKTQIITQVLEKFPREINNYYEPFLGGGSVLLGLLSKARAGEITMSGKIYASDINPILVHLYIHIQQHPEELIACLTELTNEFGRCQNTGVNREAKTLEDALTSPESYYYWSRHRFNATDKTSVLASALMIFLNKTCFRGVYREGPRGFNVPYGSYKQPAVFSAEHIRDVSALIKDVEFRVGSFAALLTPCEGDFVYLDPPYAPETDTSFVSYTSAGFDATQHSELFALCHSLTSRGIKFLMSNSAVETVRKAFAGPDYTVCTIECRRSINSKNPESTAMELLINN